ncbi:MAG: hypothetical protein J5697_03980, partial [Clostridia bacterium]|nr:hypothetical protein [Clostridia bacterium]
MINLSDLLYIEEKDYSNYKVHFATGREDKKEPYKAFLIDGFKKWQEFQTKKNFGRQFVISLIYYDRDVWMFGGVYKILNNNPTSIKEDNGWEGWKYETELTDIATDYIGRAFFKYKKDFRASYPTLEPDKPSKTLIAKMPLSHILDKRVTITDFIGFDNVNIDYKTLKYIITNNTVSWKTALSNVKGIYLIVDALTGRQ